jgi:hypothetical protein
MRRAKRRLFNLFAFSLLAFAIYLNFFYKEPPPRLLKTQPAKPAIQNTPNKQTVKIEPAPKK